MEKIPSKELEKIAEKEKVKKAITLYLDPKLVENTREFLGNKKSVSQFINDILEQISDLLEKKRKAKLENKENDIKKEEQNG